MIPLEVILLLLDKLKQEVIEGLSSPGDTSSFGFGMLHGQFVLLEEFHKRLNNTVETANRSERKASDDNSGQEDIHDQDDEYQL